MFLKTDLRLELISKGNGGLMELNLLISIKNQNLWGLFPQYILVI